MKCNCYYKRKAFVFKTVSDQASNLSYKEVVSHLYYWCMYEQALQAKKKASKRSNKYAKKLYTDVQTFKLRKSMNDL